MTIVQKGYRYMGEYVSLSIGNYDYLTCKNSFGDLLLFFTKEDLKITSELLDGEEYKILCFYTTVEKASKCLDCLGHTLFEAKRDFECDKADKIEFAKYGHNEEYVLELLNNYNFENWSMAVQKYAVLLSNDTYDSKIQNYPSIKDAYTQNISFSEKIVLDSLPFGDSFFGLSYSNIEVWNMFRVVLEAFEPETPITLDYSNLYHGGWCNEFPEPENYSVAKTIILTEGKYDSKVISDSIKILYPYMAKFFSFINFSDYNVQGSTNFLTHYFKLFAAAGIQNRIIALYDNDSAGLAELIALENINIPNNFRAIHLPDLKLTSNYPTLGPDGRKNMDINGKACSIELFLGRDVLQEDGNFIPIQWKGYVDKTKTYQGEIMYKQHVQDKFDEKVNKAPKNGTIDKEMWEEMEMLLNAIFDAFND